MPAVGAHRQSQIVWHHTVCAHLLSQNKRDALLLVPIF